MSDNLNAVTCPTDEQLAAAVEKIIAAVHENLPKLKITVFDLVRVLTDAEWATLKDDEERRRAGDPRTKWQGSDKPGAYWKECTARLERARGARSAECRFPYCDCAKLSAEEKAEWECRRAEREAYKKEWVDRVRAEREAKPAEDDDLHDVAARLPAIEKLKRDLDYCLPESGRPLANIALTREQAAAVLELLGAAASHAPDR